jgi:hypothetical protein
MTESGHAASFGIDLIIMASAGGVELAVGAAAVERHDGVPRPGLFRSRRVGGVRVAGPHGLRCGAGHGSDDQIGGRSDRRRDQRGVSAVGANRSPRSGSRAN